MSKDYSAAVLREVTESVRLEKHGSETTIPRWLYRRLQRYAKKGLYCAPLPIRKLGENRVQLLEKEGYTVTFFVDRNSCWISW